MLSVRWRDTSAPAWRWPLDLPNELEAVGLCWESLTPSQVSHRFRRIFYVRELQGQVHSLSRKWKCIIWRALRVFFSTLHSYRSFLLNDEVVFFIHLAWRYRHSSQYSIFETMSMSSWSFMWFVLFSGSLSAHTDNRTEQQEHLFFSCTPDLAKDEPRCYSHALITSAFWDRWAEARAGNWRGSILWTWTRERPNKKNRQSSPKMSRAGAGFKTCHLRALWFLLPVNKIVFVLPAGVSGVFLQNHLLIIWSFSVPEEGEDTAQAQTVLIGGSP